MNHIYEIDDGATYWYSAETPEKALALLKADIGDSEVSEDATVKQWPDDKPLKVRNPDEPGQPKTTLLCREWAAAGKGCVASTEY
jgi:hypothetical protein